MKEETKRKGRKLLRPLVNLLVAGRVAPNLVTVAAVPLSLAAGMLLALGRFVWGGVLVALVGLCDTLDGELSRVSGRSSNTGAFLDSVVDRFSEAAVFTGLWWYYQSVHPWYGMLAAGAMVFSFLVSYVRARAEGAGFECRVGWFERPVRVLVLLAGLFVLGRTWTPVALAVLAAGSLATVIHRLVHVLRQVRQRHG
jgi:CDP-diacylglycerol--glycerol-3-phosphate 3-phosphatidyltransferase